MAVAQILAGLAFPDRRFLDVFGGPEAMIESPVLDEAMEYARKKFEAQYKAQWTNEGLAQGLSQGLTQGRVTEAQESILTNLDTRFGAVPDDVRAKLSAITDLARLKALVRVSVGCPDLAAFAAQL